jgi:hypothetical protein
MSASAELSGWPLVRWLDELCGDAERSGRLSAWERSFLADMQRIRREYRGRLALTEGQMGKLRQIEEKIHAAG